MSKPNVSQPLLHSLVLTASIALIGGPIAALAAESKPLPLLSGKPAGAEASRVKGATALILKPEKGVWDLSHYDSVYLKLHNPGKDRLIVWARAENPEAKGVTDNCRTATVLNAGQSATMRLRLMRRPEDPTYAPFSPFFMYFTRINVRDNTLDPSAVARLVVWLENPKGGQSVTVESVTAEGNGVPSPVPFFPFVDKYGQYKHTDWPDKIYEDADFAKALEKDKAEMAAHPGPSDWDKWGGWKDGPKQEATGFFYPKKVDDKWWLVDPSGALFYSYGATGTGGGGEASPVTDKEKWFEELPSPDGPFGKYWSEGKGARFMYYENGKEWRAFSFSGANAQRKYGEDWRETTADFLHSRLRNWGLNSIGNWSDPVVYLKRKTPYFVPVSSAPLKLDRMPDVFDPDFARSINVAMDEEKERGTAGDPWNVGYLVDNELTWGSGRNGMRLSEGVLRAAPDAASKKVFLEDLKAKYQTVEELNKAWGSNYGTWEALQEARALPENINESFSADCAEFAGKFAEKYFSTVRDAVKRVAPNNLYLGCRFNGHIDDSLMKIAAKYVDVISYNCYESVSRFDQYRDVVDKPFLVGEFGVTSDLGQMPWRGKILTEEEGARLEALEQWLGEAFTHPAVVGAHFFQFRDQPLTGRPDGEATLRGFVNGADTPHFDLVQVNRRHAYHLYKTRSTGQVPSRWTDQPIAGLVGVGTWDTQAEYKDITIKKGDEILFASDFTKGTEGWSTTGGKWEVVDGALRQSGGGEGARALVGDLDWSDYTLTLKARKLGGKEGFLIIFGVPNDSTRSWLNLGGWGNTLYALEVPGILSGRIPGSIETDRWYDIRVEVKGNNVKAYLDGKLVQEATR